MFLKPTKSKYRVAISSHKEKLTLRYLTMTLTTTPIWHTTKFNSHLGPANSCSCGIRQILNC